MYFETIPDLPPKSEVQEKLEKKVNSIEMKDSAAAKELQKVLLDRAHGFLSKRSPLVRLVAAEHEINTRGAKPFKEGFRRLPEV